MKIFFVFALALFSGTAHAYQYEVSTMIGSPNEQMPFVQEIVKNNVALVPGKTQRDYTTATVYFAWKNGVQSLQSIQLIGEDGSASSVNFHSAIEIAATNSAIVQSAVGGGDMQSACLRMAAKPDTAFLMPIGSDGSRDDSFDAPACMASNILFVAGLNAELTDLASNQSFGDKARLAVPYVNLSAPVDESRSVRYTSKSFGLGMVAGKMAQVLREFPRLRGAALIKKFLELKTAHLSSLEGKVSGARALLDFEK